MIIEYIGVALAAVGFTLLSFGGLLQGFSLGFISCLFLFPYFLKHKQYGLAGLQFYFLCANIIGILNNF